MKRIALGVASLLSLLACTPEQIHWWTVKVHAARDTGWSCPEVAPLLEVFGLPEHFDLVVWRESECDPSAVNRGSGALGLTQIMPFWLGDLCPLGIACTVEDLLDSTRNLAAAAYVFGRQGPQAWSQTW